MWVLQLTQEYISHYDNLYMIHTNRAWPSQMHSNELINAVKTCDIAHVLALLVNKLSCICEGQSSWIQITVSFPHIFDKPSIIFDHYDRCEWPSNVPREIRYHCCVFVVVVCCCCCFCCCCCCWMSYFIDLTEISEVSIVSIPVCLQLHTSQGSFCPRTLHEYSGLNSLPWHPLYLHF